MLILKIPQERQLRETIVTEVVVVVMVEVEVGVVVMVVVAGDMVEDVVGVGMDVVVQEGVEVDLQGVVVVVLLEEVEVVPHGDVVVQTDVHHLVDMVMVMVMIVDMVVVMVMVVEEMGTMVDMEEVVVGDMMHLEGILVDMVIEIVVMVVVAQVVVIDTQGMIKVMVEEGKYTKLLPNLFFPNIEGLITLKSAFHRSACCFVQKAVNPGLTQLFKLNITTACL